MNEKSQRIIDRKAAKLIDRRNSLLDVVVRIRMIGAMDHTSKQLTTRTSPDSLPLVGHDTIRATAKIAKAPAVIADVVAADSK